MVQKKAPPEKHGSPPESKRSRVNAEKRLYSQHNQDGRGSGGSGICAVGGGCGELKKMLKKSRSIKVLEESLESPLGTQLVQLGEPAPQKKKRKSLPVSAALPNYMKSTRSSTAKEEEAQVSSSVSKGRKLSDQSKKKVPSHGSNWASKPLMLLERVSSLRAMRAPMKNVVGTPLSNKINLSRATCSSTMKEQTFPGRLELSPGATEAEGTSAFKVCPYTYCSLNGHRHPPMPPLRFFLSERRRLLNTRKGLKLRGLPPFKTTEPVNEATEVIAGSRRILSPVNDLGDDFFVEIYTNRLTDAAAPVSGETATDSTAPSGDRKEVDTEDEIEGNGESEADDFDQICAELSVSEMEVLVEFLEYVECDSENPQFPVDCEEDYHGRERCGFGGAVCEEGVHGLPHAVAAGDNLGGDDDFDEIENSELAADESSDGAPFHMDDGRGIAHGDDRLGRTFPPPEEECEEDVREIDAEGGDPIEAEATLEEVVAEIEDMIDDKNGRDATDADEHVSEDVPADEIDDDLPAGIELLFCDKEQGLAPATEEIDQNGESHGLGEHPGEPELLPTATNSGISGGGAAVYAVGPKAEDDGEDDGSRARRIVITQRQGRADEDDELRAFNPRSPDFLPLEPEPEAEKVDLRHQMADERKNSEEWMMDYALRRAVDNLASGRKKKVALLVEAFETVAPEPAYGSTIGHPTVGFPHARPIKACS